MDLRLIHADSDFCEKGEITEYEQFDAVVSLNTSENSNDWMLELNAEIWSRDPILAGDYIYVENSEWGGRADRVRHNTADNTVMIYGACWRGMLSHKVVCPPSGSTHAVIQQQEANSAIACLLGSWRSDLFSVSEEQSGITCAASIRYRTLSDAIYNMLDSALARLEVCFSNAAVTLCAKPIRDRSSEIELSQDYEARIISDSSAAEYNHIIALGRGEMLDRMICELWLLSDGTITADSSVEGVPEENECSTMLYDYSSVESLEDLEKAARDKLRAAAAVNNMEFELYGYDTELELTDIVSVRDQLTGMTAQLRVLEKNLNISSSGVTIKHKLGQ